MQEHHKNKQKLPDIKHRPPVCLLPHLLPISDTYTQQNVSQIYS